MTDSRRFRQALQSLPNRSTHPPPATSRGAFRHNEKEHATCHQKTSKLFVKYLLADPTQEAEILGSKSRHTIGLCLSAGGCWNASGHCEQRRKPRKATENTIQKSHTGNKKEPANMSSKNITQPEDWWDAFRYEADAAEMSLSAWMGECCLNEIRSQTKGQSKVKKLSDRPLASRPPKNGGVK